jgi:hypothetical protein
MTITAPAARAALAPRWTPGTLDRVEALLHPATYPHPADDLRLIETHISWVVLAGPYAYKMKKPVDLGFLDFTTVQRRLADCRAEVRLNRRLCRDVYRGILWLVERDGALRLGSPGHPIEPLVWMRRLPADGMLTTLLERRAADATLMRRIARRLALFHARAATGRGVDQYGRLATVRGNWAENSTQTARFIGRTISSDTFAAINARVERFLVEHPRVFEQRVAAGRIRDGHGDFHAGSICTDGPHLYFFDCLEFSDRFRCADVAAEVAFLAMDLDHYGRADLADAFVDAYSAASGDREMLCLLDFYRGYRAYVRGKVLGFRLDEPTLSVTTAAQIAAEAEAYFDLARSYLEPIQPGLIVVMGLPGSGKTTLARALAGRLGLVHLASDAIRKELAGLPAGASCEEAFREGLYTSSMTRRTYAAMRARAAAAVRRGRGVVLDATYGVPRQRTAVRALAARLDCPLTVLVCQAPEQILRSRVASHREVSGIVSDARPELWPELVAGYRAPSELGRIVTVDTTRPLEETVRGAVSAVRDEAPAR